MLTKLSHEKGGLVNGKFEFFRSTLPSGNSVGLFFTKISLVFLCHSTCDHFYCRLKAWRMLIRQVVNLKVCVSFVQKRRTEAKMYHLEVSMGVWLFVDLFPEKDSNIQVAISLIYVVIIPDFSVLFQAMHTFAMTQQ